MLWHSIKNLKTESSNERSFKSTIALFPLDFSCSPGCGPEERSMGLTTGGTGDWQR